MGGSCTAEVEFSSRVPPISLSEMAYPVFHCLLTYVNQCKWVEGNSATSNCHVGGGHHLRSPCRELKLSCWTQNSTSAVLELPTWSKEMFTFTPVQNDKSFISCWSQNTITEPRNGVSCSDRQKSPWLIKVSLSENCIISKHHEIICILLRNSYILSKD